jgi:hypothetical protein
MRTLRANCVEFRGYGRVGYVCVRCVQTVSNFEDMAKLAVLNLEDIVKLAVYAYAACKLRRFSIYVCCM